MSCSPLCAKRAPGRAVSGCSERRAGSALWAVSVGCRVVQRCDELCGASLQDGRSTGEDDVGVVGMGCVESLPDDRAGAALGDVGGEVLEVDV